MKKASSLVESNKDISFACFRLEEKYTLNLRPPHTERKEAERTTDDVQIPKIFLTFIARYFF